MGDPELEGPHGSFWSAGKRWEGALIMWVRLQGLKTGSWDRCLMGETFRHIYWHLFSPFTWPPECAP